MSSIKRGPNSVLNIWGRNLWTDLTGPYGYRVWIVSVTTIIAAYIGWYAVIEARHERQMNRALFERSTFITMVSSGNPGAFIAAMKEFGPTQMTSIFREPSLGRVIS